MALVSIARDNGNFARALRHARELLTLDPGNAQLQAPIAELQEKADRRPPGPNPRDI
jgi:Flp pilus assembly protein TadD